MIISPFLGRHFDALVVTWRSNAIEHEIRHAFSWFWKLPWGPGSLKRIWLYQAPCKWESALGRGTSYSTSDYFKLFSRCITCKQARTGQLFAYINNTSFWVRPDLIACTFSLVQCFWTDEPSWQRFYLHCTSWTLSFLEKRIKRAHLCIFWSIQVFPGDCMSQQQPESLVTLQSSPKVLVSPRQCCHPSLQLLHGENGDHSLGPGFYWEFKGWL